jgi:hypothetical protein
LIQVWRDITALILNSRSSPVFHSDAARGRALGMSPKKLPVGELIEACYFKKFGGDPLDHHPQKPEPGPSKLLTSLQDVERPKRIRDPGGRWMIWSATS